MPNRTATLVLATALCTGSAFAQDAPIDPKASDVIKAMGATLQGLGEFGVRARILVDEVDPKDGFKRQRENSALLKVRRPSGLFSFREGDLWNQTTWYDGKTLTILDRPEKVYGQVPVPDTNSAMFRTVAKA